jgi:hypothetical protein
MRIASSFLISGGKATGKRLSARSSRPSRAESVHRRRARRRARQNGREWPAAVLRPHAAEVRSRSSRSMCSSWTATTSVGSHSPIGSACCGRSCPGARAPRCMLSTSQTEAARSSPRSAHDLERIVAKHRESSYGADKLRHWIKVKNAATRRPSIDTSCLNGRERGRRIALVREGSRAACPRVPRSSVVFLPQLAAVIVSLAVHPHRSFRCVFPPVRRGFGSSEAPSPPARSPSQVPDGTSQ